MTDLFSLKDEVAVVTGSLGLLGREHCRVLSAAGAAVVVADLDEKACSQWATELPGESLGVTLDVTSEESVKAACRKTLDRFGKVSVLVNNAAINDKVEDRPWDAESSRLENFPLSLFRKVMDVNVTGSFLCSQIFGAEMARAGHGSIINVASTYGLVGPDQSLYRDKEGRQKFYKSPAYPTSKGAVIALTRFLAAYWGDQGVRVNTLTPGGVENQQDEEFLERYSARTPLRRMAAPGDYRGALVFLASGASSYMTGANLVVDGGFTTW